MGEEILSVGEGPLLQTGLGPLEELRRDLALLAVLRDGERELLIRSTVRESLGTIDGCVDLETDIEDLAGEEIGLVGWEDTPKGRARAETLEGLCRR